MNDQTIVQNRSSLNSVGSALGIMVGWSLQIKKASWRCKFMGSGS